MSGNDNSSNASRRQYIKGIGAFTSLSFAGVGTASERIREKQTPQPYNKYGQQGTSVRSSVYLKHVSELRTLRKRLKAYESTGDGNHIFTADLKRQLRSSSTGTIDITVSTCGERSEIVSRGQYGRPLHGWQPREQEIERLKAFGDIEFIPEVISTKVGLSDVAIDDLEKIAALDFVLEIGFDPELQLPDSANSNVSASGSTPSADDLKTASHSDFESVNYTISTINQVGIIGTGYSGDTDWGKNWAKSIGDANVEWNGIDTDKAKDFIGSDWKSGHSHGTDCADTVAYMLKEKDPHSNFIVPLEVYNPDTGNANASAARQAIEYALTNDIPVSSMSVETTNDVGYCTSTLCEELQSYASAGYAVACATGNDSMESEVCHPATSYYTIGVGGYSGSCSGGYNRANESNYATVLYDDTDSNYEYCSWCYDALGTSGFQPNVYSCYNFKTDDGTAKSGTSFAAPVVAAGSSLHYAEHGSISYERHLSKYNNMSDKVVCPSSASKLGNVLHVPDL
ncbi:S8 family serine peptidase [Halorussus sp. MSC15.2]|uniref:S8 family serine peptidase n=1 Tax=Halorussus sp. MSC15.2 TaxID=2283638 RepID=UPI0013D38220|nr:S8 family serine peptidase [Halorussus sp. MSC15.2]NEU59078.1 hypothetical protein [Halorussus sp. MSC15.2]